MSTISTVLGIVAVAMTILPAASAAKGGSGVPKSRLSRLTRGVNLGAFRYRSDAPINEDLMAKIQAAGFRHVRLPVAPDLLFDLADPSRLKPDGLRRFDALLDGLLAHKLAVIVDMHDPDTRLWNDAASVDQFARFWEALARHLSGRDPEMVFLETANEPQSDTPERWNTLQGKLLAAMRRGAPRNTLVATPNMLIAPGQWDAQKALQTLTPYDDRNVVYTFHYYNPFVFTHQGATWTWDVVKSLHDVPYPSSPEVVKRLLESATETTRPYLETYDARRGMPRG
jgi:endoglucanase